MDLDAPAFGAEASEASTTVNDIPVVSQTESVEESEPVTSGTVPVVEEQRVPYSRMKAVIDRAREAERRAEEAEERLQSRVSEPRERYETPSSQDETGPYKGRLPDYWVQMYGDDERSRLGFSYDLQRQNEIRESIRRDAIEAVREERESEGRVESENIKTINQRLEDFSYSLGRELTPGEEDALLDIVDEYTPKGRDGKYAGDLIPMDKAYEVLTMRQSQIQARSARGRREATAATSSSTQGDPSSKDRDNKNWEPRNWNSYKDRIPN